MEPSLPAFDQPQLARTLESLPPESIDALPYGAIRLDASGRVTFFSQAEARLSGYGERPVIGRQFFTDIAPCMNHPHFLGRIEQARQSGTLDIEFGYVGDFDNADRELRVRVQSATNGGFWIFIQRL